MDQVTSKDGTKIAYDRAGEGPALILVDGALCYRAFGPSAALSAQLEPHFTVYRYDRRGRGDSGDTPPYSIDCEIDDLAVLIAAAGGSAFVSGVSSGAALALHAAARGLNVRKLAIYEPPFMVGAAARRPPEDASAQLTRMAAENRRGDAVAYFMTQMIGTPAEAVAPMRAAPVWPLLEAVAPTLVYDTLILEENRWDLPTQLGAIRAPTLVMAGGASPESMQHAAHSAAQAIPGAEFRLLPGQSHEVVADVIAPELVEFFGSNPANR